MVTAKFTCTSVTDTNHGKVASLSAESGDTFGEHPTGGALRVLLPKTSKIERGKTYTIGITVVADEPPAEPEHKKSHSAGSKR